jgi:hypothetical protein
MKLLLTLFLSVVALAGTAQKTINDPNVEARNLAGFHAIQISNAFDVILTQGGQPSVAVSASDKEDVARIRTTVENGVLKIGFDNEKKIWPKSRKLRAYISAGNIDRIDLGGASVLRIEGTLAVDKLDLECSGASQMFGKVQVAGALVLQLSGASDASLNGSAKSASVRASGASRLRAWEFTTSDCSVKASGASKVQISVDHELSADLSGASSVSYGGKGVIRDIKTSGASSISRKS